MRSATLSPILWVGLVACGRFNFDDLGTDAPAIDASIDTAVDATPLAYCDWSAGPPFTMSAQRRADLSMTDTEYDPFLVQGDPLTINFVGRDLGSGDLFEARRPSVTAPFETPVVRTDLGSPATEESALALEAGGLRGYYVLLGSVTEIYEVSRASVADPLRVVRQLTELGTTGSRSDPWPFADGLGLVYLDNQPAAANKIWFASRASTSDPWSGLVEAPFNTTHPGLSGATLTSNGLVIVFAAPSVRGDNDIFYATRSSLTAAFSPAQLLTAASSLDGDHEPSLRDDGCELFLTRDTGTGTKWDVYSVPAVVP